MKFVEENWLSLYLIDKYKTDLRILLKNTNNADS